MRHLAIDLAVVASLAWAASATSAATRTYVVDDSQSRVEPISPVLRWRTPLPLRGAAPMLDALLNVRVVLNLAPWVGKSARIYMVMPMSNPSSLSVEWTGAGNLRGGRLSSGQRQLVYEGIVTAPRLEDTLKLRASVDARDTTTLPPVDFRFEIEVAAS